MLTGFFIICAAGGGAFILAQLLLSVLSLGGHGMHLHHGAHAGHAGHGAGPRVTVRGGSLQGGSVRGGAIRGGSVRGGLSHGAGGAKSGPGIRGAGGAGGGRGASGTLARSAGHNGTRAAAAATAHEAPFHWASWWLHGLFTFQGLTAGATVLGLSGLAASSAKLGDLWAILISAAAAFVMMAAIAMFMGMVSTMEADGTVQLEDAVGALGTVYLGIPAQNEGLGKISLTLHQQVMEFQATTAEEAPLLTGEKVIIIAIKPPAIMEVVSARGYLHDIQG